LAAACDLAWLIAAITNDGKPSTDKALMDTCFACHQQMKARDLVFTLYAA